jgi:hypothetical protein
MAIKTFTAKEVFLSGRGDVSANVAKSDTEVMHEESEIYEDGKIFPAQDGARAQISGSKPIYTAGTELPFQTGRGLGRGHGPESK